MDGRIIPKCDIKSQCQTGCGQRVDQVLVNNICQPTLSCCPCISVYTFDSKNKNTHTGRSIGKITIKTTNVDFDVVSQYKEVKSEERYPTVM